MQWVIKTGILNLKAEGFQADDIHDVQNLVFRNLAKNGHKESAERYMNDIKLLMNG